MTTPHRATEGEWGAVRRWIKTGDDSLASVVLELADRIAALEAAATPPPAPAGGLVERITETCTLDPGRAVRAIHAVAAWLQQRSDTIANGSQWAEMLRKEADR